MPVLKSRGESLQREYGIRCRRLLPRPALPAPFGATHCVVAPGESTSPHQHHEGETFFIARGEGRIAIEGEPIESVEAGDLVYLPTHAGHTLTNSSAADDLVFYSVYWEDGRRASRDLPARCLVTAAPPTPNGDLHLGHLSGPYVAADIHARYLGMRRVAAEYLSGSDDNQSYVAVKARRSGQEPIAVAGQFGDMTLATLRAAGCEVAYFVRPSRTPEYIAFVQQFFHRMVEAGKLIRETGNALFCERCDLYLYEAHVRGACPHCRGATNGNGCEQCGITNDSVDLGDPACNHCDSPAGRREFTRFHFPLSDYSKQLASYFESVEMSPRTRAFAFELLARGLPRISVTHVADWGIPAGLPGFEGQVLYEWFEMAAGYLFSAGQLAPDGRWETFWKSENARVVQFFGFDNSFFYLTFIPAVLLAADAGVRLPSAFVTNEFYRLDGLKFSTSRNHAIWGPEALREVSADTVRFYLSYDRPETEQTSFTLEAFRETVRRELAGEWESWLAELDGRVALARTRPGTERDGPRTEEQLRFCERIEAIAGQLADCYSAAGFSSRRAALLLCELVRLAREFGRAQQALAAVAALAGLWESALALELGALQAFARAAAPILPTFSAELLTALGVRVDDGPPRWETSLLPLADSSRVVALATDRFSRDLQGIDRLIAGRASTRGA